jgi:plastocyanin
VRFSLVAGATLALLALACSGQPQTTPAASQPGGGTPPASAVQCNVGGQGVAGTIFDFGFRPDPITISLGDQVDFTNTGSATHTVTFDNGADCGPLAAGAVTSVGFTVAGTYTYHCTIHPAMKGTITVQ